MEYTPKRVQAFLQFSNERRKKEVAELLGIHTLASRGDPKQVRKTHKDLTKD